MYLVESNPPFLGVLHCADFCVARSEVVNKDKTQLLGEMEDGEEIGQRKGELACCFCSFPSLRSFAPEVA